jgi:hypothetical protein
MDSIRSIMAGGLEPYKETATPRSRERRNRKRNCEPKLSRGVLRTNKGHQGVWPAGAPCYRNSFSLSALGLYKADDFIQCH